MQKMSEWVPGGRGNPTSRKRPGLTFSLALTMAAALVAAPSIPVWANPSSSSSSSPSPTTSPSPAPSETPTESPTPTPDSSGPSGSPSSPGGTGTAKPGRPGKPGAGEATDAQDPDKSEDEESKKKRKKKRKKKEPPVVDMSVVYAAAERQLATAEADLAGAKRELDEARRAQSAAAEHLQSVRNQAALLSPGSDTTSTTSGLRGLSAGLIPTARPVGQAEDPGSGSTKPADPALAAELRRAEESKTQADQRVSAAESSFNLVRLNIDTARAVLGLAGGTSAESAAKRFTDYPVGDCDFPGVRNPNGCREAQRWAIAQTINPMKNWFYLCLNFVTIAYGHGGGHPTAISHWNAVPESKRHSPNTVAPPGALMFWGPNHVALSLGNNVLVSVDVLGTGRAWIVDFATIQAVWGLQYLGWAEPDFNV